MPPHRKSAHKARERICRLTEASKKARIDSGKEVSASSRANDGGSDTDFLEKTVVQAPQITLKGPIPLLVVNSA